MNIAESYTRESSQVIGGRVGHNVSTWIKDRSGKMTAALSKQAQRQRSSGKDGLTAQMWKDKNATALNQLVSNFRNTQQYMTMYAQQQLMDSTNAGLPYSQLATSSVTTAGVQYVNVPSYYNPGYLAPQPPSMPNPYLSGVSSPVPLSVAPQGRLVATPKITQIPEGFNKYVNSSDTLEEFVRSLKEHNLTSDEARALPIELFIKWLVIRAGEDDGEPSRTLRLPQSRCLGCQKFIQKGQHFHSQDCLDYFVQRERIAA